MAKLKNLGLCAMSGFALLVGACAHPEASPQIKAAEQMAQQKPYTSSAAVRSGGLAVSDADAQPLVRIPPMLPAGAETSGHCNVKFNISPDGIPYDVKIVSCSDDVFARNTVKSVEKWKYRVKIIDGQAAGRRNVEAKIRYELRDENGNVIPE